MQVQLKIYYAILEVLFLKKVNLDSSKRISKKRLFLYFDYEREFSGLNTFVNDKELGKLLDLLGIYKFKTTWFTVGKVIEKYPESIDKLIEKGHEIASHTYSHIAPVETTKKELKKDFQEFEKLLKEKKLTISGFHSPKNRWTYNLISNLENFNYAYDVFAPKFIGKIINQNTNYFRLNNVKRLISLGDDWILYNSGFSVEKVKDHFISIYNKIKINQTGGIGFHPWILFSDPNIYEGFSEFLKHLSKQEDLEIHPCKDSIIKN